MWCSRTAALTVYIHSRPAIRWNLTKQAGPLLAWYVGILEGLLYAIHHGFRSVAPPSDEAFSKLSILFECPISHCYFIIISVIEEPTNAEVVKPINGHGIKQQDDGDSVFQELFCDYVMAKTVNNIRMVCVSFKLSPANEFSTFVDEVVVACERLFLLDALQFFEFDFFNLFRILVGHISNEVYSFQFFRL